MNHQEFFDTVATHLLTQNRCSVDNLGLCMYRAPDGARCAIGCLIPDDLYDPAMECNPVDFVLARFPELKAVLDPDDENVDLLAKLQSLHDVYHPKSWRKELPLVAENWDLEMKSYD